MKRSSRISLLPTLMVACVVALALRIGGVWSPVFEAVAAPPTNDDAQTARDAGSAEDESTVDQASDQTCAPPSPDDILAHDSGLSKHEIQVLRSLSERRQVLDERARTIETRIAVAQAAELRLSEQIARLKDIRNDVNATLGAITVKRDERLENLVKVYESMKPKDAARIFDALETGVLLKVGVRMKHASLAAILARMSADRARLLTHMLADAQERSQAG